MKKKIAFAIPVLVLLVGAGITAKTVFTFNPDQYLEQAADKVSIASSVNVSLEASLTGSTPKTVNYTADGTVVFPANYKIDGVQKTGEGSANEPVSEIATANFIYRKDPLTEGKWVKLERTDDDGFAKDRINIKFSILPGLMRSISKVERTDVSDGIRMISGPVDWSEYVLSAKSDKVPDWIVDEFPRARSANLTLEVDESTGYVTESELVLQDYAGKKLDLKMAYSGWDSKKTDIIEPKPKDVVPKEEAERMLKAREHYKAGLASYKYGNFAGAVGEFSQAISYQPRNYRYNVWLAKAQLNENNYAEAEMYAKKAIGIDQKQADAYIVASQVLATDDQWRPSRRTQAIEYAQRAVTINSNSSDAYVALGYAYYAKALPSFEEPSTVPVDYSKRVREETPSAPMGYLKNRAIVALEKAIELDPKNVEAHFLKGFMLISDPETAQAIIDGIDGADEVVSVGAQAVDNLERAGESFAAVTSIDPNFADQKLAPAFKWFAYAYKGEALTQKFAKFKKLTEQLLYDGARWHELKGSKARAVMDDWFSAFNDYIAFAYSLRESNPPESFYAFMAEIKKTMDIIYLTI